jgi:hypothetical protein
MNQKLISKSLFIEVLRKLVHDSVIIICGSLLLKVINNSWPLDRIFVFLTLQACWIGMSHTGIDMLGAAVDNRWNVRKMLEDFSDPVLFHPVWLVLCLICYIIVAPPRYYLFLFNLIVLWGLFLLWKLLAEWWNKI